MLGSHELSSQAGSQRKRLHLWGVGGACSLDTSALASESLNLPPSLEQVLQNLEEL